MVGARRGALGYTPKVDYRYGTIRTRVAKGPKVIPVRDHSSGLVASGLHSDHWRLGQAGLGAIRVSVVGCLHERVLGLPMIVMPCCQYRSRPPVTIVRGDAEA